jgi:hypothetical protein
MYGLMLPDTSSTSESSMKDGHAGGLGGGGAPGGDGGTPGERLAGQTLHATGQLARWPQSVYCVHPGSLAAHQTQSLAGSPLAYQLALSSQQRRPQSPQSVAKSQSEYSAPAPPSSHQPSAAYVHVSEQSCGVVAPSQSGGGDAGGNGGDGGEGSAGGRFVTRSQNLPFVEKWACRAARVGV